MPTYELEFIPTNPLQWIMLVMVAFIAVYAIEFARGSSRRIRRIDRQLSELYDRWQQDRWLHE